MGLHSALLFCCCYLCYNYLFFLVGLTSQEPWCSFEWSVSHIPVVQRAQLIWAFWSLHVLAHVSALPADVAVSSDDRTSGPGLYTLA